MGHRAYTSAFLAKDSESNHRELFNI